MNIIELIFYFFFYSFIGWFVESCYCSVRPKKWINRGFLRGPICPIYGTGALVLMLVILPFKEATDNLYLNILLTFTVGFVVCDIVEFLTSLIMEKLFHARWWDYSKKRFNIQGRICLTHTIYWGIGACLFSYFVQPFISDYFIDLINPASIKILVYIFLTVFAADLIDTVINALGLRDLQASFTKINDEITAVAASIKSNVGTKVTKFSDDRRTDLEAKLNEAKANYDSLKEEYAKKAKKTRNRLFKAFPLLQDDLKAKASSLEELFEELKNKLNKK